MGGGTDLDVPEVAGPQLNLGRLRLEEEDVLGARLALERAATVGEPEVAREASQDLDQIQRRA